MINCPNHSTWRLEQQVSRMCTHLSEHDQLSEPFNVEARTTGGAVELIASHLLLLVCAVTSLGITATGSSLVSSTTV
uniref:Uncharacterized protein n=1 Tax=Timema genevievae TaxID=629358 RepID=A0A7R9JRA7_TIMGE|nr:unnamed protein product [Timema genevievae]